MVWLPLKQKRQLGELLTAWDLADTGPNHEHTAIGIGIAFHAIMRHLKQNVTRAPQRARPRKRPTRGRRMGRPARAR